MGNITCATTDQNLSVLWANDTGDKEAASKFKTIAKKPQQKLSCSKKNRRNVTLKTVSTTRYVNNGEFIHEPGVTCGRMLKVHR